MLFFILSWSVKHFLKKVFLIFGNFMSNISEFLKFKLWTQNFEFPKITKILSNGVFTGLIRIQNRTINSGRLVRQRHRDRPLNYNYNRFNRFLCRISQNWPDNLGICRSYFQKEIFFSDFYFELYIGWRGRKYINNLHLNITGALF